MLLLLLLLLRGSLCLCSRCCRYRGLPQLLLLLLLLLLGREDHRARVLHAQRLRPAPRRRSPR